MGMTLEVHDRFKRKAVYISLLLQADVISQSIREPPLWNIPEHSPVLGLRSASLGASNPSYVVTLSSWPGILRTGYLPL